MKNKKFLKIILLSLLVVLLLGCNFKKSIKIGFSATLTGRSSDLGIAIRNGVVLAVEEANKSGGINGYLIELLIKDDKNNINVAMKVDQELIDKGVMLIIGHSTSNITSAVIPLINNNKMLLVGPNISASAFSGIDDYFIRLYPPNKVSGEILAEKSIKKINLKNVSIIYDIGNKVYTLEWYNNFKKKFEEFSGKVVFTKAFTSGQVISFANLVKDALDPKPDGIVLISNGLDTAMLCQQIRKIDPKIPIIISGWAINSDDFVNNGGLSVDGVIFGHFYSKDNKNEKYLKFKENFNNRFETEDSFGSIVGYEAASMILEVLRKTENLSSLNIKNAIIKQGTFEGLQGKFNIDKYGDTMRNYSFYIIKNGSFKKLDW